MGYSSRMALPRVPDDLPPFPPPELPPGEAVRRFAAAGFLDPAAAEATWRQLGAALPAGRHFLAHREETWRTLARAADPDLALRTWSRWIEGELSEGGAVRARLWDSRPVYREGFLLLAGASPALAAELEHLKEEFAPEKWQTGLATASSLAAELRPLLELPAGHGSGPDSFAVALRRFRRLADLRIAWLDECRRLAVDLVTLQISWLADALIAVALARASAEVARRLRVPAPPAGEGPPGFAVFALGKLGSLELNYSSDIDLLFLSGAPGRSGLSPELEEVYFTRLAERLIALLSDFTEGGQLYRVDTRLRPGGSASRLVWSLQAALDYYHSEGRTWERQALIRLRPAAGDLELARSFISQIDPFIFRRTLSGEEIAELRGLKTQLERLAAERGESETHVKIGRGGIRDVEYIVQYLQLLHGAAIPELKEANLFGVLEALEKKKLLNADETDSLRRGYRFLRQVEHRIQLAYLRQTHRLPDNPRDLRRIARGLGYEGGESFRETLAAHSARIRQVYRRLFESAAAPEAEEERLAAILELPLPAVEASARE